LLYLPAYFVANFAERILHAPPDTVRALQWAIVAARVLLPLGFLVALLQADLFAAKALRSLLERLAGRPTPEQWRGAVAGVLGDAALRLGYQDADGFLEADGHTLDPGDTGRGRAGVTIRKQGHAVAAMDVDETLTEDPEFLRAAGLATLIAVENGALEGELQASRTRLADAQRAERERIGRDLHDSAQQRLVALRIRLALLGERLGHDGERAAVERLGDEVDATIAELRDVAQGLTPPLLADLGVGPALRALAHRSPVHVTVYDSGIGRQPEAVETAIYFCCLESLQNAAKHAGTDAFVSIHLAHDDDGVTFSIQDDGVGFDPEQAQMGSGLENIASRVAAVGGRVEIVTGDGRGTRVTGVVPR
jgi:signal transduction histidine kinase